MIVPNRIEISVLYERKRFDEHVGKLYTDVESGERSLLLLLWHSFHFVKFCGRAFRYRRTSCHVSREHQCT